MTHYDEVEDREYIDQLVSNLTVEEQMKLGIFDLSKELQRTIFIKQKNAEMNKHKYLISQDPETFCEYLDKKAE